MTKNQLAALCCRILGLYTVLANLQTLAIQLGSLAMASQTPGFALYTAISCFAILIGLGAGVALWIFADNLSVSMVGPPGNGPVDLAITPDRAQAIAFSVVGLSIIVKTIPNIARVVIEETTTNPSARLQFYGGATKIGQIKASDIAYLAVELVIGLCLVFGADGFVGMINSLRGAGLRKE